MGNPKIKVMGLVGGALLVFGSLLAGNETEITWEGATTTSSIFIRASAILTMACLLIGWRVPAGYLATVAATAVEMYLVDVFRDGSLDGLALKFGALLCGTILLLAACFARKKAA
jgi:hypothetical protein